MSWTMEGWDEQFFRGFIVRGEWSLKIKLLSVESSSMSKGGDKDMYIEDSRENYFWTNVRLLRQGARSKTPEWSRERAFGGLANA